MNNHKLLIGALMVIVVVGALFIVRRVDAPHDEIPNTPNTQTGDMTDGGSVSVPTQVTSKIDQSVQAGDIAITPREVLEDSRCPSDVVCIQTGTVRVRATVSSSAGERVQEFTLGKPVQVGEATVTLVEVAPYPKSSMTMTPGNYAFTWEIRVP